MLRITGIAVFVESLVNEQHFFFFFFHARTNNLFVSGCELGRQLIERLRAEVPVFHRAEKEGNLWLFTIYAVKPIRQRFTV